MTLAQKKHNVLYWGLVVLILYMPLHYYLCELLLSGTNADNILRDLLIIALTGLVLCSKDAFPKPTGILVAFSCAVLAVFGVVSAILNHCFPILNVLRTYLVPLMIFFVCAGVRLDAERFRRLNTFLAVELAIVAAYGFFQAFFLTDDFLIMLGYDSTDGYLTSNSFYISHFFGYQRSVGTFVSPNICGIILAMALCSLLFTDHSRSFRWKYVWGTLLVGGLLATFSRSAMVGFAVATGFYLLISQAWKRLSRNSVKRCVLILVTIAVALLLDQLFLDGLFLRMFLSTIFRTFNGEDPSANAHKEHLSSPPSSLGATAQAGTGIFSFLTRFGLNGPMAEEYLTHPRKIESSYYLMTYELGIIGTLVYYAPYVMVILQTIRNRKHYPYYAPAAVSLAVLASYIFLPNVQTFEVPFYCFLFLGLYCNPSVKELYRVPPESTSSD